MRIEDFIEEQKKQGLSSTTIENYTVDIRVFFRFLKNNEYSLELGKYTNEEMQEILDKYIKFMEKEKYKPKSINRKIISINKYLKFLGFKCKAINIKVQKKIYLNNVINKNEVKRLIEQCKNERDKAIIVTLYSTGMRVSELLTLTINDINKDKIYIKGKGGKYREVFFPKIAQIYCKKYLEERGNIDEKALFLGERGALKRQSINKILNKYSKKARIKKDKVHPHNFRHLFCKTMAENKQSLDIIASLAGHKDIKTTAIYTKRTEEELKEVINSNFKI